MKRSTSSSQQKFKKHPADRLIKMASTQVALSFCWLLASCHSSSYDHTLRFELMHNEQPVNCGQPLMMAEQQWQLQQFQFFIHKVAVKTQDNEWHQLSFKPATPSQPEVALIGGNCNDGQSWSIDLTSKRELKAIQQIEFSLGVPFELNHKNPLEQKSPLNQSDMFWVWQTGHKFLRWEMQSKQHSFVYHLGSTGCNSSAAVRAPSHACKNPNTSVINLRAQSLDQPIHIELDAVVNALDLSHNVHCKSEPDNSDCSQLLALTGINGKQKLFNIH
jgi:uncharacterized repeat protein (TIGR04052 family)